MLDYISTASNVQFVFIYLRSICWRCLTTNAVPNNFIFHIFGFCADRDDPFVITEVTGRFSTQFELEEVITLVLLYKHDNTAQIDVKRDDG